MDFLLEALTNWLKEMLVGGIMSNLSGMFDSVNQQVADISVQVGQTPQGWNGSIFNMIENLSNSIMVPIAGVILAIVMTVDLIQMIADKNNLHDVDTWMIFKWVFKSAAAILIVTNTWNIVMGVFDMAQSVVAQAAGVINSDASIDISSVMTDLEPRLMEMDLGPLFGLWFQSLFIGITMWALYICIFIVIYGRMIEIYLVTSVAPVPMAAMMGKEWGGMGQNYLRSCWRWAFRRFSLSSAWQFMLCWCRTSLWKMTSSWQSGAAWATPYCCALRCSKPAVSQNQSFRRTKGGFCMKKYQIIYADPPWNYKVYSKKGLGRSAESHYPTMSIEDICALPVGNLADKDCALFLWVTIPCLLEGLSVLKAWGFTYKTVGFVWVKQNRKADSLFWGMGYWTRSNVELCILATKGHPKRINAAVHQVIVSHIEEHSKKPQEARERIVSLMGDLPRIELFARQSTPGWDVWGNEVDSSISFP